MYMNNFKDFDLEFLGWYSTHPGEMDPELCEAHKKFHRQFEHFGENPVFILLRTIMPEGDTSLKDFPLQAWQGSLDGGILKKRFLIKPYESE